MLGLTRCASNPGRKIHENGFKNDYDDLLSPGGLGRSHPQSCVSGGCYLRRLCALGLLGSICVDSGHYRRRIEKDTQHQATTWSHQEREGAMWFELAGAFAAGAAVMALVILVDVLAEQVFDGVVCIDEKEEEPRDE